MSKKSGKVPSSKSLSSSQGSIVKNFSELPSDGGKSPPPPGDNVTNRQGSTAPKSKSPSSSWGSCIDDSAGQMWDGGSDLLSHAESLPAFVGGSVTYLSESLLTRRGSWPPTEMPACRLAVSYPVTSPWASEELPGVPMIAELKGNLAAHPGESAPSVPTGALTPSELRDPADYAGPAVVQEPNGHDVPALGAVPKPKGAPGAEGIVNTGPRVEKPVGSSGAEGNIFVFGSGNPGAGGATFTPPVIVKTTTQLETVQADLANEYRVWEQAQAKLVWFQRNPGEDLKQYIEAAAAVVGNNGVTHADSSDRKKVLIYTRTPELARKLLQEGIMVQGSWYKAYRPAEKPLKVIVDGVQPYIPNGTIIRALSFLGVCDEQEITSPMGHGRNPRLNHVKLCRRVLWFRASPNAVLPETIDYTFAGVEFTSRVYGEQPRCFGCSEVGHIRRNCPHGRTGMSSAARPRSMADVVRGVRRTPPLVRTQQWGNTPPMGADGSVTGAARAVVKEGALMAGASPTSAPAPGKRDTNAWLAHPGRLHPQQLDGLDPRPSLPNPLAARVHQILVEQHTDLAGANRPLPLPGAHPVRPLTPPSRKPATSRAVSPKASDGSWQTVQPKKGSVAPRAASPHVAPGKAPPVAAAGGTVPKNGTKPAKQKATEPRFANPANAVDFCRLTSAYDVAMTERAGSTDFPDSTMSLFPWESAARLLREEHVLIDSHKQYGHLRQYIEQLTGGMVMDFDPVPPRKRKEMKPLSSSDSDAPPDMPGQKLAIIPKARRAQLPKRRRKKADVHNKEVASQEQEKGGAPQELTPFSGSYCVGTHCNQSDLALCETGGAVQGV